MSYFKNAIAFFVSFMVTVFLVTFLISAINPLLQNVAYETIDNVILPLILNIGFIFFMFLSASIKWFKNKKIISQSKTIAISKSNKFPTTEKLWIYLIVFFIYFGSVFRQKSIDVIEASRIILFIISLVVTKFLILFSEKSMNIYFLESGVVITGMDIRMHVIFNSSVNNSSGYYPYKKVDFFSTDKEHIQLFLEYSQGKIVAKLNKEDKKNVVEFLKENNVKLKNKQKVI